LQSVLPGTLEFTNTDGVTFAETVTVKAEDKTVAGFTQEPFDVISTV
jgi:hypothetical protein